MSLTFQNYLAYTYKLINFNLLTESTIMFILLILTLFFTSFAFAQTTECVPPVIKNFCQAENQILTDITIEKEASIGNTILEGTIENQGFASNFTIRPHANFSGGSCLR